MGDWNPNTQVAIGDFHQLPPVAKREAADARAFAFEAACWASCVDASLRLTRVYRQVQHPAVIISMLLQWINAYEETHCLCMWAQHRALCPPAGVRVCSRAIPQ